MEVFFIFCGIALLLVILAKLFGVSDVVFPTGNENSAFKRSIKDNQGAAMHNNSRKRFEQQVRRSNETFKRDTDRANQQFFKRH